MENRSTQTAVREQHSFEFTHNVGDRRDTQTRLDALLAANLEIAREESLYHSEHERFEENLMKSPLSTVTAFAYFGTMLGLFVPFAMFSKVIFEKSSQPEIGVIIMLLFANIGCTVAGYFSGKFIGKIVVGLEKLSWNKMLLALPFIGIFWGIMTGGAGGLFIFVIGAIFGAVIAAIVGGVALPFFTIFHRILKRGDSIEEKHFFPLALGITSIITALILGL